MLQSLFYNAQVVDMFGIPQGSFQGTIDVTLEEEKGETFENCKIKMESLIAAFLEVEFPFFSVFDIEINETGVFTLPPGFDTPLDITWKIEDLHL